MTAAPVAKRRRSPLIWGAWLWCLLVAFFVALAVSAIFYDRFPADERVAHAIQNIDVPALGGFFDVVNFVGNGWFAVPFAVVVAFGFAVQRSWWEAALLPLTLVPRAINSIVKDVVDRPRPSPDLLHVTGDASGPGFPSGHTVGTAALFGLLFFLIPAVVPWRPLRWALQLGCLLAVAAAGPARVYVGVHWPSDTLAGYLLALLLVGPLATAYLVGVGRRRTRREAELDSRPS